jgi:hypothetical protein
VPTILVSRLPVFRPCFAPIWDHIPVLVSGFVQAPGTRPVTQMLRVTTLTDEPDFDRYYGVLNRTG